MLIYVVVSIIIIYLILKAVIKIKFHFWSRQPVFHIYDLHHWFRPNRVIESTLPQINEYTNLIDIRTCPVDEMSEDDVKVFCNFIRDNYLRNKRAHYLPDERHIIEYMKGSNHSSYVSIYRRPKLDIRNMTNFIMSDNNDENIDIFSVITSRILHITIKSIGSFPIYYIDNLCVNPEMRKKGVAPKAIQTLHYHLRRNNNLVKTFLFKREGEMTAIVPLTTFTTQGYDASMIPHIDLPHTSMSLISLNSNSMFLFVDFMKKQKKSHDCIVVPELTNLNNMVKAGIISLHGIIENDNLIALYVFRDSATVYDGERAIELICSISACHFNEIYYAGFTQALHACCKEWSATKVIIDGIGGNKLIINCIRSRGNTPFLTSPSAFFLYNYVSYTFDAGKCFLLC